MRKLFLFMFGAFILSTDVSAQELVPLTMSIIDEQPVDHGVGSNDHWFKVLRKRDGMKY